jgi:transposase-like protein
VENGTFWNKITNFGHDWLPCCCEHLISWAGQQISDQMIVIKKSEKVLIPRSSSPNDNCQLHLKTHFQRLKTCFHCHSVFVVHTNTPGRRHENLNDTQFGYFDINK